METKDAGRVAELKSALQQRLDNMDRVSNAFKMEGNGVVVSPEMRDDFRKNLAEAKDIRGLIQEAEGYNEVKSWADQPQGAASLAVASAAGAAGAAFGGMSAKSLGEMFTDSDEFKALIRSGGATMPQAWEWKGRDVTSLSTYGQKDVYIGSGPVQTTRGFGQTQFDPLVPRAYRRARVRDLFPVAGTSANLIDYFRVIGFGANRLDLSTGASVVADRTTSTGGLVTTPSSTDVFGVKPHSSLTFESAQSPVRTIAHYEIAHRNVLADEPQMQATIDNELLYGLRLQEDYQILSGTGTGEDLLGILNTPRIQTYAQQGAESLPDALRRAATRVILAYYDPTGFVMHPYDWENVELTKTTFGSYVLVTNVAVGAQRQVWQQPVVDTPAMPQGTFLTGAWGLGAQLYDRQMANIRIAEQHADFFIRNAVAILAEERLALAVKRPESFVKGTFNIAGEIL
ncbi:MAG: hypothetical protein NVS3B1_21400 [Marmoricola sp.]